MDLFGNIVEVKSKKKVDFYDYETFVKKFDSKKTTDDCYTPPYIYDAILDYVSKKADLTGKRIIRPFVPNGDYKAIDYKEDDVVIDNPPFSILSQIISFYIEQKVPFFLFAPTLTLISATKVRCTTIVCGASMVYEHGAKVNTSFATNIYGDGALIVDGELYALIDEATKKHKKETAKQLKGKVYPDTVASAALLGKIAKRGISLEIPHKEMVFCTKLDCGISVFGGGVLLSERAAAERAALSPREMAIIKSLSNEK